MATSNRNTTKNSATDSSKKQPTTTELRKFYNKYKKRVETFERAENYIQLLNPSSSNSKTYTTFSKDLLRTYMQNPLTQYKNLRGLSRFLYYVSQVYRRLIHYNASMIDLNYYSIIPIVDLVKGSDQTKILKSFYETSMVLEHMNLPLEFLKVYITCWREDVFFGCVYYDEEGFFILPLDPDFCKVTGVYPSGDLGFDMDMSYFSRKQEILEMWGEPFVSMYDEYQKDTTNNRWQPMTDENCVCLKVNIDDWETPLPPYIGMFNSLINLEDLNEIMAVADEQQIYKLLLTKIPLLKNSNAPDDFAVDVETAIKFFNEMVERFPDYTNAAILPGLETEAITFDHDQASDVNKVENATKSVLNTAGGAQILNSSTITGTTAWTGAMKSDEDYALSSLLPQTQAWLNRFLSYQVSDPSRVKFIEVTKYTKEDYKNSIRSDAQNGVPTKLLLNTINGFSPLETMSLNFLEEDCLELSSKFTPMQSSNTMNTGELQTGRPTAEETGEQITDDGEASRDKRDASG